ncbi:PACE efflux transporter [Bacteroides propionicifaciens]|uniref:PACE efflux transporter n=1 Tax=Bacteroides propionicifaciens TaxID=392838 RepID=UPI0003624070|nr:PACE efflux transporter [Bacteroides propionicifaciens]
MRLVDHLIERSPYERVFHAVLYEVVGIITSTPIIIFFTGKGIGDSGLIALIVSITATIWNYIYNFGYDKLLAKYKIKKTSRVRVIHGLFFEVGLVFITVPILALTMGLGIIEAFKLEFAMLVYFFPYTIVFNWIYDKAKSFVILRLNTN